MADCSITYGELGEEAEAENTVVRRRWCSPVVETVIYDNGGVVVEKKGARVVFWRRRMWGSVEKKGARVFFRCVLKEEEVVWQRCERCKSTSARGRALEELF
ncbi:hypothetical protein HanIR_Chr02g0066651 [Helianthus annuus]|nr:hypothetical protein HanIR_Chr02g0066651 [Helianthus annuus]